MTSPANDLAGAYSVTADRWQSGPGRIYDRLARVLVERSPVEVRDAVVGDIGAGTGAASRAARRAGARRVVALDLAVGMLRVDAFARPPAVVGDATRLPLRSRSVDVGVAAFSLNHLDDPVPALEELRRVLRPGGGLIVGTYASDDGHPVKAAVEAALTREGWQRPPWYEWMRTHAAAAIAEVERMAEAADVAGLHDVSVEPVRVPFPDLGTVDLIAWRLGMAQHAPFVATLPVSRLDCVIDRLVVELEGTPPLTRSILVLTATSSQDPVDPDPQRCSIVAGGVYEAGGNRGGAIPEGI